MRIACAQTDVRFNDPMGNATRAVDTLRELKAKGVHLVVFPEAYLTGYCVDSPAEARQIAIESSHEAISHLHSMSEELDLLVVAGFAETSCDHLHNAAVLLEPGETPRFYRKTHLPYLGLDRFVEAGCELPVFDTKLGRIGILICFDLRPPEATRSLALRGVQLLVLPTNWPVGAETSADHVGIARAAENKIFVATCDRVGSENGFTFIGRSKIIAPSGKVLAEAGAEEAILIADIDLKQADQKLSRNIPGKYEIDVFASRRPDLYTNLTAEPNPA